MGAHNKEFQVFRRSADTFVSETEAILKHLSEALSPEQATKAKEQLLKWQALVAGMDQRLKFRINLASRHEVLGWLLELYMSALATLLETTPPACAAERLAITRVVSRLQRMLTTDMLPTVHNPILTDVLNTQ